MFTSCQVTIELSTSYRIVLLPRPNRSLERIELLPTNRPGITCKEIHVTVFNLIDDYDIKSKVSSKRNNKDVCHFDDWACQV